MHTCACSQIAALRAQLRQALEDRRSAFSERDDMKQQLEKKHAMLGKLKRDAKDCEILHVCVCMCVYVLSQAHT